MSGASRRHGAVAWSAALVRWGVPAGSLVFSVAAVAAELGAAGTPPALSAGAYLAAGLTSAALFARFRRPVATTVAILVICLGYHLVGYPGQGPAFALFAAVYSIPAAGRLSWSLPAALAVGPVWSLIPLLPPNPVPWLDGAVVGPALGMSIVGVVGAILTVSRRQTAAEHAAQASETRARIARDIHDVLAHTIAAITVQSNLALDALDDDPELARTAIRRVRDLARAATPQLRHSLLQLREDGRPEQPQPTLGLIGQVLADARAAGFTVDARIDVRPSELDAVVELTVARIVQEAVTNAVRHSGGARLSCVVAVRDGRVIAEVTDDGRHAPGPEGLGIPGMRERAAAVGGTVETLPAPDGFTARASIPLPVGGFPPGGGA